jgi:hypothetical protein
MGDGDWKNEEEKGEGGEGRGEGAPGWLLRGAVQPRSSFGGQLPLLFSPIATLTLGDHYLSPSLDL